VTTRTSSEDILVEQPALARLCGDGVSRGAGWQHLHGGELAPDAPSGERKTWSDVALVDRLRAAVARIKTDTHRYVRHQETWLRRNPRLVPIDVTRPDWMEEALAAARRFLAGSREPSGRQP
jgi:hypothetical protein